MPGKGGTTVVVLPQEGNSLGPRTMTVFMFPMPAGAAAFLTGVGGMSGLW